MGNIRLKTEMALQSLGRRNQDVDMNEFAEIAIHETAEKFREKGFAELVYRDGYLYTSVDLDNPVEEHVGQMRISFSHDPCGKASVNAQLIKDTKGEFTFRKWNPNR